MASGAVADVSVTFVMFSAGFLRSRSKVKATSLLEKGLPSDQRTPVRMSMVSLWPPSDHCDEVASHGVAWSGFIGV
nr:hypothetical protein [Fodinicola feengrottensis]